MLDKSYKLPNMEHKFKIQSVGKDTGLNWVGEFTYRRPTLSERGQIDTMRARLNGDLKTVAPEITYLHSALAHLRFTLQDYPKWWEDSDFGASLFDGNVVMDIYTECISFETKWREKVMGGDSKEVEEGNHNVTESSGSTVPAPQ